MRGTELDFFVLSKFTDVISNRASPWNVQTSRAPSHPVNVAYGAQHEHKKCFYTVATMAYVLGADLPSQVPWQSLEEGLPDRRSSKLPDESFSTSAGSGATHAGHESESRGKPSQSRYSRHGPGPSITLSRTGSTRDMRLPAQSDMDILYIYVGAHYIARWYSHDRHDLYFD